MSTDTASRTSGGEEHKNVSEELYVRLQSVPVFRGQLLLGRVERQSRTSVISAGHACVGNRQPHFLYFLMSIGKTTMMKVQRWGLKERWV